MKDDVCVTREIITRDYRTVAAVPIWVDTTAALAWLQEQTAALFGRGMSN